MDPQLSNGCPGTPLIALDKFRPKFLENRRVGLEYFLKSVSPVLVWRSADCL